MEKTSDKKFSFEPPEEALTSLEKWIEFSCADPETMKEIAASEPAIRRALEAEMEFFSDKELRKIYMQHEQKS